MNLSPYDRLGFTMDKSCRLYVPFYRFTHPTAGKVPDLSPYGNHGTIVGGAGPWPVPIPSGEELVTNPYFEGNPPTGWSTANSPEEWSGNGWRGRFVDSTPSQAYIYQDLPVLEAGRKYIMRVGSTKNNYNTDWYLRLSGGGGDLYYNNGLSYDNHSLSVVVVGDGYTGRVEIGNPSDINQGGRDIGIVSIRPLLYYESKGWAFDNVDDSITFSNFSALAIQSEFTILVWMYYHCMGGNNDNWGFANYPYLTIYPWSVWSGERLYYDNGALRNISFDKGSVYNKDPNKWLCYSFIYKVGVDMRIYLNAQLKASGGDASAPLTYSHFRLGNVYYQNNPNLRIGEIAVFSRAMSSDEIMNYYLQTRHRYN